ncbi:MAG: hypothetical protein ACLRZH_14150 [Ruthenibacterium lactatiformans]
MMGARELLPVFSATAAVCSGVPAGGAGQPLFVVTILYRAPLELPLYTCCLVGAVGAVFFFRLCGITLARAAHAACPVRH